MLLLGGEAGVIQLMEGDCVEDFNAISVVVTNVLTGSKSYLEST